MRRLLTSAAVLAAALPATSATAAPATPYEASLCGWASLTDPRDGAGGRQVGYLDGGPVLLDGGGAVRTGRLACSLQVNAERHADPDAVRVTSETTPLVVALPPTPIEYEIGDGDYLSWCTEVQVDGDGTYYWDGVDEAWTTDPSAPCDNHVHTPEFDPVGDLNDAVFVRHVDPLLCPVLAAAYPPEGDVPGVWECPPYHS